MSAGTNDDLHEPRGFVPAEKMGPKPVSRYQICGVRRGGWICTEPERHTGDHVAMTRHAPYSGAGDDLDVCDRWPSTAPAYTPGPIASPSFQRRADDDYTVVEVSTERLDLLASDPFPFDPLIGIGGAPTRASILPTDAAGRKQYPIASGFFDYFPDAICAVANLSWIGNNQHNPGMPLHWDRTKSTDEPDTMLRHFAQRGTLDSDGVRHSAKMVWRALAILQKEIEAETR